jgi:hypothetical protein
MCHTWPGEHRCDGLDGEMEDQLYQMCWNHNTGPDHDYDVRQHSIDLSNGHIYRHHNSSPSLLQQKGCNILLHPDQDQFGMEWEAARSNRTEFSPN